jgi:hypothetical protein
MVRQPITLREFRPAIAWREAERRAIPGAVAAFFVFGVLAELRILPFFHQFAPAAITGAVAVFLTQITLYTAIYHGALVGGSLAAALVFAGLITLGSLLGRSAQHYSIYIVLAGGVAYIALQVAHARVSSQGCSDYLADLLQEYEREHRFSAGWIDLIFWALVLMGAVAVLALFSLHG